MGQRPEQIEGAAQSADSPGTVTRGASESLVAWELVRWLRV